MVEIDCQGCPFIESAPSEKCFRVLRSALSEHREVLGVIMHGAQDVWIRESGVNSLRTLMAEETAWEGFREKLRSLPCPRSISQERIDHYLEKARAGSLGLFCLGNGASCERCLERQREALEVLFADIRKAKKTLAADRFRIVVVPGGSGR